MAEHDDKAIPGAELDALAAMPSPERQTIIRRAANGNGVNRLVQ
jgi:hypothetical protein